MAGNNGTPGGLNTSAIAVVGIVSVLLVVVSVYAVQAWYFRMERTYIERTVYQEVPREVQRYRQDQQRRLEEPRWRSREQELIAIPIEDAMDLYVEQRLESGS